MRPQLGLRSLTFDFGTHKKIQCDNILSRRICGSQTFCVVNLIKAEINRFDKNAD